MKKDAKTNPEETKESKKRPEGSEQLVEQIHRKRRRSLKFWLTGALVLLIAVGILVGVLVLRHRRNDGVRRRRSCCCAGRYMPGHTGWPRA